ncbi:MAG: hypothetical protein KF773_04760 [Deltaproteobacteria bacterium]|nr:hypothetical protein [Deltaproteobacteria bacterium]
MTAASVTSASLSFEKRGARCRRPRLRSSSALRFVSPFRKASSSVAKAGASAESSMPTWPFAMRDSISWTQRFACALVGWCDGL